LLWKVKGEDEMRRILLVVIVLCGGAGAGVAQTGSQKQLGIVEKLGNTVPLDLEFYDENGQIVTLRETINKPTIVTFVYYRCPGICSPLLTELASMVDKVDLELGKDYQILTVSFDHREKPELAREKKDSYISVVEKPIDPNGWRFFTGDSANIAAFTDAAGFYFLPDSQNFVHAGALIFVSKDGKITRYINGIRYLPFTIKMAIIETGEGKVSPTIAQFLQFCFSYDRESNRYALNLLRISAVSVLVFAVGFVLFLTLKPKKKSTS
jgi:protein SCO1